jgi:hypothetical protein
MTRIVAAELRFGATERLGDGMVIVVMVMVAVRTVNVRILIDRLGLRHQLERRRLMDTVRPRNVTGLPREADECGAWPPQDKGLLRLAIGPGVPARYARVLPGKRGAGFGGNCDSVTEIRRTGSLIVPRCAALLLALALTFLSGCQTPDPSSSATEPIAERADPVEMEEALQVLRRMSAFIASHSSLRFTADVAYDAVQHSGQKIEFGSRRTVTLRRPDLVRVDVLHRGGERELLTFDGKRLSLAIPNQRVYASKEFHGTAAEAFEALTTEYDLATPLSDVMRRDLPNEIATRAESALRLDSVIVEGVRCDHLAFRGERVDFQIFVREGDEPAPVRIVIDYRMEPGQPQFRARFGTFDWAPEQPDGLFRYVPSIGAQRIPFREVLDLLLGPLEQPLEEEGS